MAEAAYDGWQPRKLSSLRTEPPPERTAGDGSELWRRCRERTASARGFAEHSAAEEQPVAQRFQMSKPAWGEAAAGALPAGAKPAAAAELAAAAPAASPVVAGGRCVPPGFEEARPFQPPSPAAAAAAEAPKAQRMPPPGFGPAPMQDAWAAASPEYQASSPEFGGTGAVGDLGRKPSWRRDPGM